MKRINVKIIKDTELCSFDDFFNKMFSIENNCADNIKLIKKILSHCNNTNKVNGYSLDEWFEFAGSSFSLIFVFGFNPEGVFLNKVLCGNGLEYSRTRSLRSLKKKEEIEEQIMIIKKQAFKYVEPPFRMR